MPQFRTKGSAIVARNTMPIAALVLAAALAHGAFALAIAAQAGSAAQAGTFLPGARPPAAGYSLDSTGTIVENVVPGGPAWISGLRAGWRLDLQYAAELGTPGAVAACQGDECRTYSDAQGIASLAGRWSFELVAVAMSVVGLVLVVKRQARIAALLGFAALALSAPTWAASGQFAIFPVALAATSMAPPFWLVIADRRRIWSVLLVLTAAVVAAWLFAGSAAPGIYDSLESARVTLLTAVVVAGIVVLAGWLSLVDTKAGRERRLDAVVVAVIASWALVSWWFRVVPDAVAVGGAATLTTLYFASRHRIRRLLLRVASAELRQRASLEILEAERSRVARDIHDVPLQEISAVIRQLGHRGDSEDELQQLREVARHLREVSVSLRPPVLDDVGLGAALTELLSRQPAGSAAQVEIRLDDSTDIDRETRPPQDVELAVYRIVQEAVANAHRHSGAARIVVSGEIEPNALTVTVADDGRGIDEPAATQSERDGRLGIASMRERAQAIHASLMIGSQPGGGTVVSVAWRSP